MKLLPKPNAVGHFGQTNVRQRFLHYGTPFCGLLSQPKTDKLLLGIVWWPSRHQLPQLCAVCCAFRCQLRLFIYVSMNDSDKCLSAGFGQRHFHMSAMSQWQQQMETFTAIATKC